MSEMNWSATRRARLTSKASPADIAALSLAHAHAGDLRAASRAALLAERLLRLEATLRRRTRNAETALREAQATLERAQPPAPQQPPAPEPEPDYPEAWKKLRRDAQIARGLPTDV